MKYKLLTLFIISISLILDANELGWVDTQVEAIKPSREGVADAVISELQDPFSKYKKRNKSTYNKISKHSTTVSTRKTNTSKQTKLTLGAIMNKSALINGKWYKLNSYIGNYKLNSIESKSVTLIPKGKEIKLTINRKPKIYR